MTLPRPPSSANASDERTSGERTPQWSPRLRYSPHRHAASGLAAAGLGRLDDNTTSSNQRGGQLDRTARSQRHLGARAHQQARCQRAVASKMKGTAITVHDVHNDAGVPITGGNVHGVARQKARRALIAMQSVVASVAFDFSLSGLLVSESGMSQQMLLDSSLSRPVRCIA